MTPAPPLLAKSDAPPEAPLGPEVEDATKARADDERAILCAACRAALARGRDRIEVEGAHVHTFVNTSVVPYRIACFAEVPGAVGVGDESTFWTWFKGCAWRVVVCAQCVAHVGWIFRRVEEPGESFFGLIVDRVVET